MQSSKIKKIIKYEIHVNSITTNLSEIDSAKKLKFKSVYTIDKIKE